jgi:hypothetical protein
MRKLLGYYQIGGAVFGLVATLWALARVPSSFGTVFLTALVPLTVVGMAGRSMLLGRPRAVAATIFAQSLQIPIVILPEVTWKFVAGLIASYTVAPDGTGYLWAGVEATWMYGGRSVEPNPLVGVNVAAILVVVATLFSRRTPRDGDGPIGAAPV